MRTLIALALLSAAPGFAAAQATKSELIKLAKAGISEDVILLYVQTKGYAERASSDDLVEMKKAGVGDRVLEAILTPSTDEIEAPRTDIISGTWSVGPVVSVSSYSCPPAYRRYAWGTLGRPAHYRSYCRPAYRVTYSSRTCQR